MSRAAYRTHSGIKNTDSAASVFCVPESRRRERTRRSVQRRVRRLLFVMLLAAAFLSGFFGRTLLNAHAEEELTPALEPYYTCVQLKQGDNLWNLAHTYAKGSGYTVREYVDELKRLNHLDGENIHAGEFLTVVYYDDARGK